MTKPTAFSTDKNGITWLPTAAIRTDAGTQHRPALDEKAVDDYAQQMRAKEWVWRRSPIKIAKESDVYWMIGGFHRLAAAERADLKLIGCVVQPGTRRDAILASFSENSHHGVRLDNASKRNKVTTLLADEEWRTWSDNIIAKRCGVSPAFVGKLRVTINVYSDSGDRTYVNKQGGVSKMGTANIGKRSEKGADSGSVEQPKTLADLDTSKWYPVFPLTKKIVLDPFDSAEAVRADERYKIAHVATYGLMLKNHVQYRDYQVAPALPPIIPMAQPTPSAPELEPETFPVLGRSYPTGARGNMIDDKYYPVINRRGDVHDEAFDDHDTCLKCPRYPGNKPVLGRSINHLPFYATFRLVAPVAKIPGQTPAGVPEPPTCRMIFELNDRFEGQVLSFEEQFELDVDYWGELARTGELPASTEPTRLPFAVDRWFPVDDAHKQIYHDPRLVAETIHSPYRAVIGRDLNLAPAFQAYQRIDCDLPCRVIPASAKPEAAAPQAVKPNFASIQDDKFYVTDSAHGGKIFTQAYASFEEARRHVKSPFDQRVESGKDLNVLARFERWTLVEPASSNGNGKGAAAPKPNGTPWMNGNTGKDTPRSAWEAQDVANAQAAQKLWLAPLDFRILVETNLVDIDAETLKRIAKPLRQLVIDAVSLANGQMDRGQFGESVRAYVSVVSEKPVAAAAQ